MKKVLKFLFAVIEVIIIVYAIGITTILLCKNRYGYTQLGKTTLIPITEDNEEDFEKFNVGDLVLTKEVKYKDVNAGDEIYYYQPADEVYYVKIDTVENKTGDNKSAIYTVSEDGGTSIASERVLGQYNTTYANVGKVLTILSSRIGFLLLVILPIMLLFIYQIYNLIVSLKYDKK